MTVASGAGPGGRLRRPALAFAVSLAVALWLAGSREAPLLAADAPAVTLEPRSLRQGSVGLVTLTPEDGTKSATVVLAGKTFELYPDGKGRWRGPVGVDLDVAPGKYTATVQETDASGEVTEATLAVRVTAGKFPVQRLTVPPKMAHPDPESEKRIKAEEELVARIYSGRSPKQFTGRFVRPVPGELTNSFGGRRIFNGSPSSPHSGTDLRGAAGTPIKAPAAGTVVLVHDLYFSGNTVILDHGCRLFTLYGHMSATSVREGQVVAPGTELGKIGQTGRATGPHLHWGCKLSGARVNPIDLTRLAL